ncbi:hypothetical protein A3A67_01220 [Candidatus Peribacteria bacterium RIFCSPLOWO2_01_FULL_51_18]|nr:MAG: hypothetical protein A3A67_01220 [Candidatus Peribacteria bacterium RIFCSPLOWO2_01_FULL_51_18]
MFKILSLGVIRNMKYPVRVAGFGWRGRRVLLFLMTAQWNTLVGAVLIFMNLMQWAADSAAAGRFACVV